MYLVQRAKYEKDIPVATQLNVDMVLDMDYMGASEFEWGALPKSLSRIRERLESGDKVVQHKLDLVTTFGPYKGNNVYVITNESKLEFAISQILEYLEDRRQTNKISKVRLKEWIKFESHFEDCISKFDRDRDYTLEMLQRESVWWDILGDFFWTVDPSGVQQLKMAITKESPVKDTDLRMFDPIKYLDKSGQLQNAKIVGIGDDITVKHANGKKATITVYQIVDHEVLRNEHAS